MASSSSPARVSNSAARSYFKKLSMEQISLKDKRVVIRVDLNVPLKDGHIKSSERIMAAVPTIQYALKKNAKSIVLISHLARPLGNVVQRLSLAPIAEELKKLLDTNVIFMNDCVGQKVEEVCKNPPAGTIILLENLRFHMEEEGKGVDVNGNKMKPDAAGVQKFRTSLAKLGDIYINDTMAVANRPHSSMLGEGFFIRVAGLMMYKEMNFMAKILDRNQKYTLAIIGGNSTAEKVQLIDSLVDSVNEVIVAGAICFNFLKVLSTAPIGSSHYDESVAHIIPALLEKAKLNGVKINLPVDFICGEQNNNDSPTVEANMDVGIEEGYIGGDIGKQTRKLFESPIRRSKVILWCGAIGIFEVDKFKQGTITIMEHLAAATKVGITTIVAGADTIISCNKFNFGKKFSHVSSGGTAVIDLLSKKPMPGIEALSDIDSKEADLATACPDNVKECPCN